MFATAGYSLIYLLGGGGLVGAMLIFIVAKMFGKWSTEPPEGGTPTLRMHRLQTRPVGEPASVRQIAVAATKTKPGKSSDSAGHDRFL